MLRSCGHRLLPIGLSNPRLLVENGVAFILTQRGYSVQAGLSLRSPTYMIWGANTGVGKTLVAAGLASAVRRSRVSGHLVVGFNWLLSPSTKAFAMLTTDQC